MVDKIFMLVIRVRERIFGRITRERSNLVSCGVQFTVSTATKYETSIERCKSKIAMKGRHVKVRSIKFMLTKRRQ